MVFQHGLVLSLLVYESYLLSFCICLGGLLLYQDSHFAPMSSDRLTMNQGNGLGTLHFASLRVSVSPIMRIKDAFSHQLLSIARINSGKLGSALRHCLAFRVPNASVVSERGGIVTLASRASTDQAVIPL